MLQWLRCNAKYLVLRVLTLSVRAAPFRLALLQALGVMLGLVELVLHVKDWRSLARFAALPPIARPAWSFVFRFFVQRAVDRLWTAVFYDASPQLGRHVVVENPNVLKAALAQGRGAVILGAHHGPVLDTVVLRRTTARLKVLTSAHYVDTLTSAAQRCAAALKSRKITFFLDEGRLVQARRAERELVRHIEDGGAAVMYVDFPIPNRDRATVDFLEHRVSFSQFPFRLALRRRTPVLFSFFARAKTGGYTLHLIPCKPYSSPAQGTRLYAAALESQVTNDPTLWKNVLGFFDWVEEGRARRSPERGETSSAPQCEPEGVLERDPERIPIP